MRKWILVCGLLLLAKGSYIYVKAGVAQVLLELAWDRAQDGDPDARPWPWADTHPVGRLRAGQEDLIVLSGTSGRSMAFGPGHLESSAAPGSAGNVVIAAHRDTHFEFLRDVAVGDRFSLEGANGVTRSYRVSLTAVVEETDTRYLAPRDDRLTLITCWPFDAVLPGGLLRYVVVATPV